MIPLCLLKQIEAPPCVCVNSIEPIQYHHLLSSLSSDSSNGNFNLKALTGSSGYKFGCLAKIVNYMKVRAL